jgi:hypothetical protein
LFSTSFRSMPGYVGRGGAQCYEPVKARGGGGVVMAKKLLTLVLILGIVLPVLAAADDSLVRFEGGIGVIPVSRAVGVATVTAAGLVFPDVLRNDVHSTPPGGQPWVIASLSADVKFDGRISADGRGLLLAGSNNIGTSGGQSVRARLFCGGAAHNSGLALLEANGDFRIDDVLSPIPPVVCNNPVLLIVSGGGNWFAAGIPKLD